MCPNIQRFSNQKKTHDIPMLIIDIFLYCVKYNFLQYNISPIKSRPSKKKRKESCEKRKNACQACAILGTAQYKAKLCFGHLFLLKKNIS